VLALGVMTMLSRIDYHRLRPDLPCAGITVLLVMSVVGFGHGGGGAALAPGRPGQLSASEARRLRSSCGSRTRSRKAEQIRSFSIGMLRIFSWRES
jgi:hypothetical protein